MSGYTRSAMSTAAAVWFGVALAGGAAAQVGHNENLLNPNLASEEELLALPHMNETLATAIMDGRPFLGVTALNELLARAMSAEQLEELYGHLFIPIDLNSAGEEAILSIPGLGNRMLHEFLEYRPYENIARFRREIGKYVDDDELARLERYVTVKP